MTKITRSGAWSIGWSSSATSSGTLTVYRHLSACFSSVMWGNVTEGIRFLHLSLLLTLMINSVQNGQKKKKKTSNRLYRLCEASTRTLSCPGLGQVIKTTLLMKVNMMNCHSHNLSGQSNKSDSMLSAVWRQPQKRSDHGPRTSTQM